MSAAALVLPPVPVTPLDYHRIVDQNLKVPTNKELPIPVGLLACQRDPLLRELHTTVVSCNIHHPEVTATSGKKKKAPAAGDKLFMIVLHDTILFPEGGGQPTDTGVIRTTVHGDYEVVEVKRVGGHAVHFVKSRDGEVLGLEVGASVIIVLDETGYARRLDHMCMHTSQHLLSALLETHLNLPTLSWSLTTYPTPSYVELQRALVPEEIERIQGLAHTLAYEGRKVHIEVEPLDADNHPGVAMSDARPDRTIGKGIPSDYTGGVKRTVIIDGVDRNPCCGTHLPTLNNLQLFLLPQTESLARGNTSTSRLFFLCGPRLHAHLSASHALLTETAGLMSCSAALAPARVAQVIEERKRAEKRGEELESELSRMIVEMFVSEMSSAGETSEEGDNPYKRHYHRTDDPVRALGFLQLIASVFEKADKPSRPFTLVLSSSPVVQTSTSVTTVLVLSSDDALTRATGEALKAKLAVKGGGKGMRWSGKWIGLWKAAKEGGIVKEIICC